MRFLLSLLLRYWRWRDAREARFLSCRERIRLMLFWAAVTVGLGVLFFHALKAHADEADYTERWCHQHRGQIEYVLPDRTRVDCLTATHAVEIEWAAKWYQAVGQSLHYAAMTGLRPGIVLLVQGDVDNRYVGRLDHVLATWKLPIDVWVLEAE